MRASAPPAHQQIVNSSHLNSHKCLKLPREWPTTVTLLKPDLDMAVFVADRTADADLSEICVGLLCNVAISLYRTEHERL